MTSPPVHIVVLAKAPRPGLAKTRLIPALGAHGAARLADRLLAHALRQALTADLGPVELCRTPGGEAAWESIALPRDLRISDQGGGDLGDRMARAAQRATATGHPVLLMGSDCPALTAPRLRAMARALNGADAVITPVSDGGYSALALRRYHPDLFHQVPWSTSTVTAITLARARALGWTLHCMPTLHDIDEPGDLAHLPGNWQSPAR